MFSILFRMNPLRLLTTLGVYAVGHLRIFNTGYVNTLRWGHNRFIPHNHYPISFDDK